MGGNALKPYGVETKRFTTDILYKLYEEVSKYFSGYQLDYCRFYRNKEDHGDLDILVKTGDYDGIKNIIESEIKPQGTHYNDNVITFNYGDYQVDMICIEPIIWNIARVFYSYDPIPNLLGKIARGFDLNFGKDGLYYRSIKKRSTRKIYLSNNPYEIFDFLGYDFNDFLKGFNELEDIFKFVINGKYFDKTLFDPKNMDGRDRKRNRKRKSFNLFLKYIDNIESNFDFSKMENKMEHIEKYFNGFLSKVDEHEQYDKSSNMLNSKFRDAILHIKSDKILGLVIDLYKKDKKDFDKFITNNEVDKIKEDFDEFYKRFKELYNMIDKELGFGKKMGSTVYFHKNYIHDMPYDLMKECLRLLPIDFEYTIIKWDKKTNDVSFINVYDFDKVDEPVIRDSYKISKGHIKYRQETKRKQIYHHKWMFVKYNYQGFDYTESMLRSMKWYKKIKYKTTMIGYKDYWDELKINESYTEEEMSIANKTSRTSKNPGAVSGKALVPIVVEDVASEDDLILDFGAGKYPLHTYNLRSKGFNVKCHEFGDNFNDEYHDSDALSYKYDIVYASNVLNVQSSLNMLKITLSIISEVLKDNGIFIGNYPNSPRKMDLSYGEIKRHISEYFNIEDMGKNVMKMTKKNLNESIDPFNDDEWDEEARIEDEEHDYKIKLVNQYMELHKKEKRRPVGVRLKKQLDEYLSSKLYSDNMYYISTVPSKSSRTIIKKDKIFKAKSSSSALLMASIFYKDVSIFNGGCKSKKIDSKESEIKRLSNIIRRSEHYMKELDKPLEYNNVLKFDEFSKK